MERDMSSLYKGNGVRVHHGDKEFTVKWHGFLPYSGIVEWYVRVMLYI